MKNNTAMPPRGTIEPLPLGQEGLLALMRGTLPPTREDPPGERWLILTEVEGVLGEIGAGDRREAVTLAETRWPGRGARLVVWSRAGLARERASEERRFQRRRRRAAYHEAGHAVVAWHLGVPICRITIGVLICSSSGRFDPKSVSFGTFEYGDVNRAFPWHDDPLYKRKVRIAWAGPMAEYRFRGASDWMAVKPGRLHGSDLSIARAAAAQTAMEHCGCLQLLMRNEAIANHEQCTQRYIEQAGQEVGQLLDTHWRQVESVASELERRREIRGEDLDRLIGGVPSIGSLVQLY